MGICTLHFFSKAMRLALAVLLPVLPLFASAAEPPTYSISIVPQFSAQQLLEEWQPLLKRVGDEAGVRFNLRFYPTIPAFENGFLHGEADFVFVNPYHVVLARQKQGYVPLLHDRQPLTGILVVASGSPVKTLRDLDGKKIAFPAPNAFGASLYMRALLAEQAKIKIEPSYVNTHANVYRQVALGEVAAGGGVNQTFEDQPAELRARLRKIFETPAAAPHPLCAHPRVTAEVRRRVIACLLYTSLSPRD